MVKRARVTPTLTINGHKIGPGRPVYIIAEIGTNYNGDKDLAKEMIKAAVSCGVDAVKFQIITADRSYVKKSDSYSIFKKIELRKSDWEEIVDYARSLRVDIFATFVNCQDLEEFAEFNWPVLKISSTNLTNFPLLEGVARQKRPVIMSTGVSYLKEVKEAVQFFKKKKGRLLAILQCTSLYPTPPSEANLLAIKKLATSFPDHVIGFSDHTKGIECAVAAVALGACIIEKHFTLDEKCLGQIIIIRQTLKRCGSWFVPCGI